MAAVFVFHARKHYLPGGYLGVDLFFAISGFLITGLLLQEVETRARLALRNFFVRRAIRLLPALVVLIAALGIAGKITAYQAAAALFYFANWVKRFQGESALGNVLHTWSLSAEEQFYLVWPLIITVIFALWRSPRISPRRAVFVTAGVGALVAAMTVTHMETLFAGSLMAAFMPWLMRRGFGHLVVAGGTLGAGVLLWLMVSPHDSLLASVLVPVSSSLWVAAGAQWTPQAHMRRLAAPVLWVGRTSYGIYLWHFPFYMTLPLGMSPAKRTAMVLVATLAAATASWYAVERPIARRLRPLVAEWK